jgi:hypothetical protein
MPSLQGEISVAWESSFVQSPRWVMPLLLWRLCPYAHM